MPFHATKNLRLAIYQLWLEYSNIIMHVFQNDNIYKVLNSFRGFCCLPSLLDLNLANNPLQVSYSQIAYLSSLLYIYLSRCIFNLFVYLSFDPCHVKQFFIGYSFFNSFVYIFYLSIYLT